MSSSARFARDAWMVIIGFMISLTIGYGIIVGFYQPEIHRLQEEVRAKTKRCEPEALMHHLADASLYFIGQNHPEVASSIPEIVAWQGGRTTLEGLVGHETYVYSGEGWMVTVEWDIVPLENLTYTVTVEHDSLVWKGEVYMGNITEIDFKQ